MRVKVFLATGLLKWIVLSEVLFGQSPEILKWEEEIRMLEYLDKQEQAMNNSILFTGSSSIRLWNGIQEDMEPWPVVRRGYGGARLSDFVHYARRILFVHDPEAIVIFIANDISGDSSDLTPARVGEYVQQVLDTIRIKFAETPVFWIAVTPTIARWQVWSEIRQANSQIRQVCDRNKGVYFIDTEQAFLNRTGLPKEEYFQRDGLHLNDSGYFVWAGLIKDRLEEILQKPFKKDLQ